MNCKPGDLAIIIGVNAGASDLAENIGAIVVVIKPGFHAGDWYVECVGRECKGYSRSGGVNYAPRGEVADAHLRPVSGIPESVDEPIAETA